METKNKIVRYSERFNGMEKASAVLWHYKNVSAAEKEVDGVYVVPAVYLLLHRSFGAKIDRKEAEAVCAEYGVNFPGKNALRLLEFACAEIDKALHDAGIYSHIFYEDDVEAACWTADDSAEDETEKRYLLLFVYDADRVEPIKQRFVLVDGCRLYQHCSGVWIKTLLELLLGDKTSNLLLADEKELFLQKEQKLSYIGRCKEIRNDEIIVCDTGIFQYVKGEVRCLLKIDVSREEYNNSNCGHEEWVDIGEISEGGTVLVCEYKEYDWCDNGEQIRNYAVERRFEKDEQGVFQPL